MERFDSSYITKTNTTIEKCSIIVQNFNFVQNMMDLRVKKFSKVKHKKVDILLLCNINLLKIKHEVQISFLF